MRTPEQIKDEIESAERMGKFFCIKYAFLCAPTWNLYIKRLKKIKKVTKTRKGETR